VFEHQGVSTCAYVEYPEMRRNDLIYFFLRGIMRGIMSWMTKAITSPMGDNKCVMYGASTSLSYVKIKDYRLKRYAELVFYKAYADLRAEAARGYLGILWWVLEPILYMAAFYVVFGLLMHRGGEGFVAFLLCGLVSWKWFDSTVRGGGSAIKVNALLMQQVYLPKYLFPFIVVLVNSVKFLIVLGLLLLFLQLYGIPFSLSWLALPVLVAVQMLLIVSVTCLVASVVPFLPDLKLLIDNGLMLMMFMSGVFFDIGTVDPEMQGVLRLNPMASLIEGYRAVLLKGVWPDWSMMAVVALFSLVVFCLSMYLIKRFDRLYPRTML